MHKDIEVVCSPRDRLRSARNALRFPHVERKEVAIVPVCFSVSDWLASFAPAVNTPV